MTGKERAEKLPPISRAEWIERYGGQRLLDAEGFNVVRCVQCDDSVCHGWRVVPKDATSEPTDMDMLAAMIDWGWHVSRFTNCGGVYYAVWMGMERITGWDEYHESGRDAIRAAMHQAPVK